MQSRESGTVQCAPLSTGDCCQAYRLLVFIDQKLGRRGVKKNSPPPLSLLTFIKKKVFMGCFADFRCFTAFKSYILFADVCGQRVAATLPWRTCPQYVGVFFIPTFINKTKPFYFQAKSARKISCGGWRGW